MKLRVDQLASHLRQSLAPVYLISGDEPLQVGEAGDAVRRRARELGYAEREVFTVEPGFDWSALRAAADSLSLFAARRLVELRMPGGKPGEAGAKVLAQLAEAPAADTLLLITAGKLEPQQQRSAWYSAIERHGVVIPVWPVQGRQLSGWIAARLRAGGLQATPEAVALLAERVEGNLLAADQEIAKLRLLHGSGSLDAAQVAAAVGDSARYDVYQLADAALGGEAARTLRILQALREEGVEPVLVLWALARELRALAAMTAELERGSPAEQVLARQRVWEKRKPLMRKAMQRHPSARWRALLVRAGRIDRIVKGVLPGSAWDELVELALAAAGAPLKLHRAQRAG